MVTVYSKNNCVQCKMTKRFLDSNNVSYREINLDEQPEYVDQVKELGFSAAPVIQTPTEVFSGFQPRKLKQLA
ncbi:TPA: glutaredoxin-like protein NrdH [Streptococcus pneumoniae]|nr:nrdH-redoxin [Streptococcus pneumoniae]HEW8659810.1 glutaredoxin-like protein NrdH [Streptococcus pneumoniae]